MGIGLSIAGLPRELDKEVAALFFARCGPDHEPAYTVHRGPSGGVVHRVWSYKARRVLHLMSTLEFHAWLEAEFLESVTDIREQYAIGFVEEFQSIARAFGFRPPHYNGRVKGPTADLLLTVERGPIRWLQAVTCKYDIDFEKPRVEQLLTIEETFWDRRSVTFVRYTDKLRSIEKVQNYLWVLRFRNPQSLLRDDLKLRTRWLDELRDALRQRPDDKIVDVCFDLDNRFRAPRGSSLCVMRFAMAQGLLPVHWANPYSPASQVRELFITEPIA